MKKRLILGMTLWASLQCGMAQSLEKMQWFNEPEQWKIENQTLTMYVTPQSDYWRISHYGFTVDDAPFYYATYGGEFEVKVKVTGDYKTRFDQPDPVDQYLAGFRQRSGRAAGSGGQLLSRRPDRF